MSQFIEWDESRQVFKSFIGNAKTHVINDDQNKFHFPPAVEQEQPQPKYWKVVDGSLEMMNAQERAELDARLDALRVAEWVAANTKSVKQLEREQYLRGVLDSVGKTGAIVPDDLEDVMDRAETWIANGSTEAQKRERLQVLTRVLATWHKLGDAVYEQHFGRQVTEGDAP